MACQAKLSTNGTCPTPDSLIPPECPYPGHKRTGDLDARGQSVGVQLHFFAKHLYTRAVHSMPSFLLCRTVLRLTITSSSLSARERDLFGGFFSEAIEQSGPASFLPVAPVQVQDMIGGLELRPFFVEAICPLQCRLPRSAALNKRDQNRAFPLLCRAPRGFGFPVRFP